MAVKRTKAQDVSTDNDAREIVSDEMAARYEALAARAREDRPKAWAPHKNEDDAREIVGTFVRMDYGETDYGTHGIAIIETPDGTRYGVWLLHNVLRNEFVRARPAIGDMLAIRYLGMVQGEKREYASYRVEIERNTPQTVDWDTIAGQTRMNVPRTSDDDIPF